MGRNLFNIILVMISVIPKEETKLKNALESLQQTYLLQENIYPLEAANEIISLIRYHIGVPKKNWQRKIYIILREEKLYDYYLKKIMN